MYKAGIQSSLKTRSSAIAETACAAYCYQVMRICSSAHSHNVPMCKTCW